MKRLPDVRLRRLCLKLERGHRGYEPLLPQISPPLHVYIGKSRPRFLLYCTKEGLLQRWVIDGVFPASGIALSRYGLPTPQYVDEIRLHVVKYQLPLMFVGDLDPLDLTIFSILRQNVTARYLGIDDRWLDLCEAHRRSGDALESAQLTMGPLEREHWSIAQQLLPDVQRLVGPKCFALLESGKKLEIEGACNTGLYGREFPSLVMRHLQRRSVRVRREQARTVRPLGT